ncbi:DUF3726 domain-containing protein [Actibacterium sp. XHP0104]|uniref:DUF3726 domain-containing protein n=1 Tax=Actibacterium sp. XHP0104 TaxID=2984335 RepID=UPI0021E8604C|nr:DUF3726 domain-containing protein [Actibacterium sp. XHP0104]MCV2880727.1 DUF3726 domain-containing protein [Actibacterium sp. XHP0104]
MMTEPNDPTQSGPDLSGLATRTRLSRNEIEGACTKAARGAGLSWGHAEEAGFAAGWLHAHGIDGAAALLAHLEKAAGKPWDELCPKVAAGLWLPAGKGAICPLILGSSLSDYGSLPEGSLDAGLAIGPVSQPVLVVPFLARLARSSGHPIAMRFATGTVYVGGDHISGDIKVLVDLAETRADLSAADTVPETAPCQADYECDAATLAALGVFAMRTTVPPSERSRSDAGAGTDDND